MDIVLLSPKDWQLYKQIRLESLKSDPQAFGSSYQKEAQFSDVEWQERPSNPQTHIFVAKEENKVVGILAIHEKDHEAHLWGMYVNPAYRGQGIAKKLFQKIFEKVKSLPHLNLLSLDVNPLQEDAVGLYKSLGFVEDGTLIHLMGDGKEHTLLRMKREIF